MSDRGGDVDVIVVGGGAGGLTAATQAARREASVVLVADGPLGGDCTHTGCVPSKTLLAAAAKIRTFEDAMAVQQAASGFFYRSDAVDVRDAQQ